MMRQLKSFVLRFQKPKYPRRRQIFSAGSLIIWAVMAMIVIFSIWATQSELDEVTTGEGKVIPSSHEQVIQSLEGGILKELKVKEGDIVESGQVLALLDPTQIDSSVQESISRLRASLATAARLEAETSGRELKFPPEVLENQQLVAAETALYLIRRANQEKTVSGLQRALDLINRELLLTSSLVSKWAASDVEVLRLKRQANDLRTKLNDAEKQYIVKAHEDLAKANADVASQRCVIIGRADSLKRTVIVAPVKGIVKNINVTTTGGVIPQRGELMTIIPLDEHLLVETHISPRDVAFIIPGQRAVAKITAYDYNIYGTLDGQVVSVSPDTFQDDVHRDKYYYRVYIRTVNNYLLNKRDKHFPVYPGMVAMAEIHTGKKTVMEYLLKPLNRAKEALRER